MGASMKAIRRKAVLLGRLPGKQKGALILLTLLILLVISMLGMSSVDSTGLEMKMSSNSREQQQAFEAAAAFGRRCKAAGRSYRRPVVVVVSAGTPDGAAWERAARFARAAETTGRALVLAIGVGPSVDLYQLGDCSPSDAPAHRVQSAELPAFFEWLAARLQGEARALPGTGSGPEGGGSPPAEVGVALRMVARARC